LIYANIIQVSNGIFWVCLPNDTKSIILAVPNRILVSFVEFQATQLTRQNAHAKALPKLTTKFKHFLLCTAILPHVFHHFHLHLISTVINSNCPFIETSYIFFTNFYSLFIVASHN